MKTIGAMAQRISTSEVRYSFSFPYNTNAARFLNACRKRGKRARYIPVINAMNQIEHADVIVSK